ncbi:hypothetical protein KIW84_013647 [Lathyrus oleraceus]|uniref:cytochrome-c oxidase n=1 Tax=Pisum sativum TaxID=3888 RepID=A0A9D5BKQ7_PEA|nr:hypothetical protein KIW84_013647 [Pisum sativum]
MVRRESGKNPSNSVTEKSSDSSVTQDDPTPSTLASFAVYPLHPSEVEERKAMHYTPYVDLAFNIVEHVMRDVEGGWLLRYMHANGARYVPPWGQMSFWGATGNILPWEWQVSDKLILVGYALSIGNFPEGLQDPAMTIKAIGHQWYRTYEYSDYNNSDEQSLTFDSYTIPEDDLELGQSRLLEVNNRVVVPAKTYLRIIVTPVDVPHSWVVPSLGVKCDVVPGRLNQISISVQREGVYYGQCSEICGTNHAFTPIIIEAIPSKDYGSQVSNQLIP